MHKMNLEERRRDYDWAMAQFEDAEYAMLAVNGDTGHPYNIPLCVFRVGDKLYFHTAPQGNLNDLLVRDSRVCITCVTYTKRDPDSKTMRYRSAMAFGTASPVSDSEEKKRVAPVFFGKYLPDPEKLDAHVDRMAQVAAVWRVDIVEAVGKESLEGHDV